MKDIHGKAIWDYYNGDLDATLLVHNNYGEPEEMPVEVFFREEEDLTDLEVHALSQCTGSILDLGAGAGALSFILQKEGHAVTPLENSPGCIRVMQDMGLLNIIEEDFWQHKDLYDTILVLMNGLGMAGTLDNVAHFLHKCASCLHPDGKILIDSSDISYLYEEGVSKPDGYFGEVQYQYEYKKEKGQWFPWIYVDADTLAQKVNSIGLKMEILMQDENDQYLACITKA